MARPGLHLVLVYDPKTGDIYKKLIAAQLKQKNKDFYPKQLDKDFMSNKIGDLTPRNDHSEKEMFPIELKDIAADATYCFDVDATRPEFRPFKSIKEEPHLLECMRYLYESYPVFCMAYHFFMLNQINSKLGENPGQNLELVSPLILTKGIQFNGLWEEFFREILRDKLPYEVFEKQFLKSCHQRFTDIEEAKAKNKIALGSRACFIDFLLRLSIKHYLLESRKKDDSPRKSPSKRQEKGATNSPEKDFKRGSGSAMLSKF